MCEEKPKKKNSWIGKVILIIVFLLLPGIRGYQNIQLHEYILFVFFPIAYLIYDIVKEAKKNRLSS